MTKGNRFVQHQSCFICVILVKMLYTLIIEGYIICLCLFIIFVVFLCLVLICASRTGCTVESTVLITQIAVKLGLLAINMNPIQSGEIDGRPLSKCIFRDFIKIYVL